MNCVVKNLIGIFTIIEGKINLIMDNNDLITIPCNDTIENEIEKFKNNNLQLGNLDLKQCHTFSKKTNEDLEITILYIDIINYKKINIGNYTLIPINQIQNNVYTKVLLDNLKKYLVQGSIIKKIYPEEFVLPEIQKVYEEVFDKKYDRRNFRKKLMKMDIIESLDKINENRKGRPAKLYKFKNITDEKILF